MSITKVNPYFRDRMAECGYLKEWEDEFNIDNIPRELLDRVYHLGIGSISSGPANQTCFVFDMDIVLTVHSKISAKMGSSKAADEMLLTAEKIVECVCAIECRLGADLKQVYPSDISFDPIDGTNDNIVRVQITFGVQLIYELRKNCPQ